MPGEGLPRLERQRRDRRIVDVRRKAHVLEVSRALDFIAERVEGNLLAAHQEIQKLALLHPEGVLDFESVQDAVLNVARYDVFKLSEAVLAGDIGRTARMLRKGYFNLITLV